MTPTKFARAWVRVYFVFEFVWAVFWAIMMPIFKFALGADGAEFRLGNELQALHLALMPSVAYGLEDGNKLVIILYGAVIWTDLSRLLEIVIHTPSDIGWAWGTSLAIAAYGVFIGAFALAWFVYVWVNEVRFTKKTMI